MATDGGPGKGGAWQVRPGVPGTAATSPPKAATPPSASSPVPANMPVVPEAPPASPAIVKALSASQLFKSFTDTGTQLIASIAQEKTLPPGTPIFVENMIGEALYVIADGQVRVAARAPDGREHTLVRLNVGDSLGEAALLRTGPRLCSAYAETVVRVVEIARRDIVQLQKTKPQACIKLLMNIVDLLAARTKDVDPELKKLLVGV